MHPAVKLFEKQFDGFVAKSISGVLVAPHHADERIVSISQPYVRPIVRRKAGGDVEFGAKVLISLIDGHATIEKLSWENFNEGNDLLDCVERYRARYGFYPEAVLADKLFRNRENLAYCKAHGVRLSGPVLGRPKRELDAQRKRQEHTDSAMRNAVEGKFGEGKLHYGLNLIMTKLKETSEVSVHLQFLVMNLENRLRLLLSFFLRRPLLQD